MARVEQKVAGLEARIIDLSEDIRAFAPLVGSQAEARAALGYAERDRIELRNEIGDIRELIERDANDRGKNRGLIWVAAIGLIGTFLSSTAVVIASLFGG